jgi:hypothetical protein
VHDYVWVEQLVEGVEFTRVSGCQPAEDDRLPRIDDDRKLAAAPPLRQRVRPVSAFHFIDSGGLRAILRDA